MWIELKYETNTASQSQPMHSVSTISCVTNPKQGRDSVALSPMMHKDLISIRCHYAEIHSAQDKWTSVQNAVNLYHIHVHVTCFLFSFSEVYNALLLRVADIAVKNRYQLLQYVLIQVDLFMSSLGNAITNIRNTTQHKICTLVCDD